MFGSKVPHYAPHPYMGCSFLLFIAYRADGSRGLFIAYRADSSRDLLLTTLKVQLATCRSSLPLLFPVPLKRVLAPLHSLAVSHSDFLTPYVHAAILFFSSHKGISTGSAMGPPIIHLCFATISAFSFPSQPECPRIHVKLKRFPVPLVRFWLPTTI